MRILRYFSLRGLDGHHTRVYPRRSLGLVDYSEPHPYTTTDVSYRSVLILLGKQKMVAWTSVFTISVT
jgi:hypothetical protein